MPNQLNAGQKKSFWCFLPFLQVRWIALRPDMTAGAWFGALRLIEGILKDGEAKKE